MKIENHSNFVVLTDDDTNLQSFATFLSGQVSKNFKGQNVVVNLVKYSELELSDLLLFLETSNSHRKGKQSFVIVNTAIEIDDIPAEMIVVPTLQEAGDIIEMEEIERDLGF